MNDSKILLMIGVREIGLKSESTSCGGEYFWIEVTLANFHIDGINPSRTDALKIEHKGRHNTAIVRHSHGAAKQKFCLGQHADEWSLDESIRLCNVMNGDIKISRKFVDGQGRPDQGRKRGSHSYKLVIEQVSEILV